MANWLAAQRARRVVFIAGMFPLPFLGLLSAATVVMTAELNGVKAAVTDAGLALLVLAGIAWAAGMDVPLLAVSAVVSWGVWLTLGSVAGRTGSLTLAVQTAVMLALLALAALLVIVGDPAQYWVVLLEQLYSDLLEQGLLLEAEVDIARQAQFMTGLVIAGSLTGSLIGLLLGTSWAGAVRKDDPLAQFRDLQLGYVIGVLAALIAIAQLLGVDTAGAPLIFGAAFMFHGIAVVAWWANELSWPRGWWLGCCIIAILLPDLFLAVLLLLAAVGFVDNWYSLRRKPTGN
jgi:hypothetical protein